ncbi:MAG: CDP-2,3-bis-(O-geranylgeranyl)-sn-glycerol synthase [Sulfolobales archaeon]
MDPVEEFLRIIAYTLYAYAPAMASNGAPVLLLRGRPIDMGCRFIDGKRIFGDGKTFEGMILFLIFGTAVGGIYASYTQNIYNLLYGFLSGFGAFLGDLIGAFIKRRLDIPRGEPAPILDQTGFLVIATLIIKISGVEKLVGFYIDLRIFIAGILLVLILHIATNYGAYKLGLKKVPY